MRPGAGNFTFDDIALHGLISMVGLGRRAVSGAAEKRVPASRISEVKRVIDPTTASQ